MDNNRVFRKRGRRKSAAFNPTHKYIEDSVEEFLKRGGTITKVEQVNKNFENYVNMNDSQNSVDDFLFDR